MRNIAFFILLTFNLLTLKAKAQSYYLMKGEPFEVGIRSVISETILATKSYEEILQINRIQYLKSNFHINNQSYKSYRQQEIDKWRYLASGIIFQLNEAEKTSLFEWVGTQNQITTFSLMDYFQDKNERIYNYILDFTQASKDLDIELKKIKSEKITFAITDSKSWTIDAHVDQQNIDSIPAKRVDEVNLSNSEYYMNSVELNKKPEHVTLNPNGLIPERNTLNNSNSVPTKFKFNALKTEPFNADTLQFNWRPDAWYNAYDGVKLGLRLKSNYQKEWYNFDAGVYYSLGTPQGDFDQFENDFQTVSWFATFESRTEKLLPNSSFQLHAQQLDGLDAYKGQFLIKANSLQTHIGTRIGYLNRTKEAYLNYLFDRQLWNADQWNGYFEFFIKHHYSYKTGSGKVQFTLRTSAPESDYNYSYLRLESKNIQKISILPVYIRVFAQYGSGNNWAPESQLYLAGANPEEQMSNPLTRSAGIIPADLGTYSADINNFHESGGLNLRGYAGYLAPFQDSDGTQHLTYRGTSGISATGEIPWTALIPLQVKSVEKYLNVSSYFFGDVGMINSNNTTGDISWADARADAGIGAKIDVFQWWNFTDLKPVSIRFDVPFWLNSPPPTQEYFEFRWLIGLSKTF